MVAVLVALLLGPGLLGPVPVASTPSPRIDYVALGDSYSAGPFIPAQELMAGTCLRSTHDYPALLAGMLQVDSFADVTCTGADTSDLSRSVPNQLPGPPPRPQLDALGPGTDLVTVGIGGNDFGLFGSIFHRCTLLARSDPAGAPCRRAHTVDGVDTMYPRRGRGRGARRHAAGRGPATRPGRRGLGDRLPPGVPRAGHLPRAALRRR